MTTTTIPRREADLDDAWISDVLGAPVRITATEGVGVGSAFACLLYRLRLEGPQGTPDSVVVKLPVEGEVRAMLDGIGAYGREVVFYRDIAAELPVRTPVIHAALQAGDSTDFVLVMEDLVDCEPVDQIEGLTLAQAEAVVDALARMHSWSWERTELLDRYADRFWPVDSEPGGALQQQYGQLFAHVWSARRDAFAARLGPRALDVGDRFAELQPELVAQLATPRCLTHGELRADNLFIDGAGDPVLFDFQAAQQECGVRELQYLLGTSLPESVLAANEDDLLERYVNGLRGSGVEFTTQEAREHYRAATTYNLLWPVMACVRYEAASQRGRDTLDSMVARMGAAIERQFEAGVRAAHAEEERCAGPVTELHELPFTYAHLTTEWLSKLLGARVSAFRAEDADDLGRGHARIWLEYAGDSTGRPTSIFCKDSQRLKLRIFNASLIAGEVQFYNDIQPALGVETPECIHVGHDPRTHNSLLIFEDLREHGLEFCTDRTHVTRELAEGQMRHLAAIHARFWGAMDRDPLMTQLRSFESVYKNVDAIFGGRFGDAVMNGFHAADAAVAPSVRARAGDVWPGVERALEAQRVARPTLTHNDSHIDNWYPSPADGRLRLGDWQIVARGDPAFDLALVVSTSPTVEDRRAWERDLIALYVDELAAAGGPRLTFDDVWTRYRRQLFLVLAWWTPTVKSDVDFDFHDLDGTVEIIRRITTAIEDLDGFNTEAS